MCKCRRGRSKLFRQVSTLAAAYSVDFFMSVVALNVDGREGLSAEINRKQIMMKAAAAAGRFPTF